MADPHHQEPLDGFDRFTVAAYRLGLTLSALGVGTLGWALFTDATVPIARWAVYAGVALIVANLHLYHRGIRWFVGASAWVGVLFALGAGLTSERWFPWLNDAGLGFAFVVLSAAALKERYCFRVPVVVLVPLLLAGALIPMRMGAAPAAGSLLALAAAILLLLAGVKWTMPLHYDIGDKRQYQI